ncbi:MAG: AAA family ATPase [Verrucomicrobiota bacterium]
MSKPYNEDVHAGLIAYMAEHTLSQADMARELQVSSSAVNKYVNMKPEGDVSSLESLLTDVMKNAPKRRREQTVLVETAIARNMAGWLERVRKTADIAVLTGDAGIGKTCGAQLYSATHPTSIFLTATRAFCNERTQRRLLWQEVNTTGWRNKERIEDPPPSQDRYLIKKFRGSSRLVIIDGCHRLTGSGIEWWFDFHDATGLSLAFVGNACFVDKLRKLPDEDQHLSRVGASKELKLEAEDASAFARQILAQVAPDHVQALMAESVKVVMGPGHGRTLRKQASLALDLLDGFKGDMALAFRAAGRQLLAGQMGGKG